MSTLKLFAPATLASVIATPALAQAVISEPGYCAQFYPTANCGSLSYVRRLWRGVSFLPLNDLRPH